MFTVACSKEDEKDELNALEIIGSYQITDTYVFNCPGETDNLTLTYSYEIFIVPDGNTLVANNINELNTSLYQGSINGNTFSLTNASGACGISGEKLDGVFVYSISCPHSFFESDAQELCGGFIIQPIFPSNLVSRSTTVVKTS